MIHCIRDKVNEAKNARDEEFAHRIGALRNNLDSDHSLSESIDNEEDEISVEKFDKKVAKAQQNSDRKLSKTNNFDSLGSHNLN